MNVKKVSTRPYAKDPKVAARLQAREQWRRQNAPFSQGVAASRATVAPARQHRPPSSAPGRER